MTIRTLARTVVHSQCTTEVCLRWRGRTIAKLAIARPLGELVLAMPYRHRRTVEHVSLPPAVLQYAKRAGARRWIVRLDERGECYELPLAEVELRGWLRPHRDGHAEWFVALSVFRPIAWADWHFIEDALDIDDTSASSADPPARQLSFTLDWRGE